jgi:uncharacterized membrane protein
MLTKDAWNIVLILLAVIGAVAIIGFVGMAIMYGGMMGGMMTCCGGMAGGRLAGLLLITAIVVAMVILLLLRYRSRH